MEGFEHFVPAILDKGDRWASDVELALPLLSQLFCNHAVDKKRQCWTSSNIKQQLTILFQLKYIEMTEGVKNHKADTGN